MRGKHVVIVAVAALVVGVVGRSAYCLYSLDRSAQSFGRDVEESGADDAITDRDITTAQNLGAPDDVIESMRRGEWSSYISQDNVRVAERAEDHLAERHGVEFRATQVSLSRGIMRERDMVTLTVESGPYAGQECTCEFYSTGAPKTGEPQWGDSYTYLRLHDEYETRIREAAQKAFGDLPEGSWLCLVEMRNNTINDTAIEADATLDEASAVTKGSADVYLSPELQIDQTDYDARVDVMESALEETGLRVDWTAHKVVRPLDGAQFDEAWIEELDNEDFAADDYQEPYDWERRGYI